MAQHPLLYEINFRVRMQELSTQLERPATFEDLVPDAENLARLGFAWVWVMGIWQTGPAGRQVSRTIPEWRRGYIKCLPDLRESDICGSPYAVAAYEIAQYGGPEALAQFRKKLHALGLRLMLDLVPNHTGIDHRWAREHPEYYVAGSQADLEREPANYISVDTDEGPRILAHGRDPYFPGWPDSLQLNYGNPAVQDAMKDQLLQVASLCDGVRCDMAMLLLPDVFLRTWGIEIDPFWPSAIANVRRAHPDFVFMAEVYWGREWDMQQVGFDYTYDKNLYDRLRAGSAEPVRVHLTASMDYQRRLARFLENHDEPRAAETFPRAVHKAAAVITYCAPGLAFFHEGQLEGRRRHASVHLCRRALEPVDTDLQEFYSKLLGCLSTPALQDGEWQLLGTACAWDGNPTWRNFIAFACHGAESPSVLAIVNFGDTQGQCYIRLAIPDLPGTFELRDQLGPDVYQRSADQAHSPGIYFDMPAWGCHLFEIVSV